MSDSPICMKVLWESRGLKSVCKCPDCNQKEKDMEIPEVWEKLASEPIDSKLWHGFDGTEYLYQADRDWVVVNEILGPYRERLICKVIKSVKIEPDKPEKVE